MCEVGLPRLTVLCLLPPRKGIGPIGNTMEDRGGGAKDANKIHSNKNAPNFFARGLTAAIHGSGGVPPPPKRVPPPRQVSVYAYGKATVIIWVCLFVGWLVRPFVRCACCDFWKSLSPRRKRTTRQNVSRIYDVTTWTGFQYFVCSVLYAKSAGEV